VEWVETTGKTVEEAKDSALDQLGVDEADAEFEVLEEPRTGLFGRTRGEARVRARVAPRQPRPKAERRERRGRGGQPRGKGGERRTKDKRPAGTAKADAPVPAGVGEAEAPAPSEPAPAPASPAKPSGGRGGRGGEGSRNRDRRGGRNRSRDEDDDDQEMIEMSETELAAQGEVVKTFLLDLLDAFGLDGEVAMATGEDGALEMAVTGPDLGLLIGPKGQTLQAIQELARTALQRQHPGETHARVRIDVGGYRERRREALARFAQQVAEEVKASGVQKALEPMSPPDRKVVHDTVNEIDGVHTVSEGEDSRRRVVILPS